MSGCDTRDGEREREREGERRKEGRQRGDTWVVFWGELQFVGQLHGPRRRVYHVHQH